MSDSSIVMHGTLLSAPAHADALLLLLAWPSYGVASPAKAAILGLDPLAQIAGLGDGAQALADSSAKVYRVNRLAPESPQPAWPPSGQPASRDGWRLRPVHDGRGSGMLDPERRLAPGEPAPRR